VELVAWLHILLAFLSLSGCSRSSLPPERERPALHSTSNASDSCGQRDDGQVHVPPGFNTFVPPARGGSYVDPQYGCAILRLTDGQRQMKLAVHHEYSTISAINQDDTRVLLITEWGQGFVVDTSGNVVVETRKFPGINSGNVPWARNSPDVFYYTQGNALYKGMIAGHAVQSTMLHTFMGQRIVLIPDDEDLSEDGDHLWIVAGSQTFLYTISKDVLGPGVDVGAKDAACGWHKIQITPSNRMLVTWSCNGAAFGRGQEIYDPDGRLYWHMFDNSVHSDVGRDLRGNEVAILARIPDTYKDACAKGGGVDTITLDPRHSISCLVDVNWAATHISYRDSSQGWVVLSFFDEGKCPDYSCFANNQAANWESLWRPHSEELVLARIDGSVVYRLAHHRSRSAEYYWAQSHASISRDGRYVVFDSNMGIYDSGLNDYSDAYLIKLR
jgi:hypothetical protein